MYKKAYNRPFVQKIYLRFTTQYVVNVKYILQISNKSKE